MSRGTKSSFVPTIDSLTVKERIDSFSLWPKNALPYEVKVKNQQFENERDRKWAQFFLGIKVIKSHANGI
jgi:hypothetical protein